MEHDRLALRKTKRLLLDWANMPELGDDWLSSMLKQHPSVFGSFAHDRTVLRDVIGKVKILLRVAWKSPDMRQRDWLLFAARQQYGLAFMGTWPASKRIIDRLLAAAGGDDIRPFVNLTKLTLMSPPPETAFDRAVVYARRMSYCEGPNCEEPFFLRGPKRERYCADCKREARLLTRKKYWNAKGKYNRKAKKALHG